MMLCELFSFDASAQLYARPVANPPGIYKMDGYEFTAPPGSGRGSRPFSGRLSIRTTEREAISPVIW